MNRRGHSFQFVLIALSVTIAVALTNHFAESDSGNDAASFSSPPQTTGPCGCSDLNDLFNRAAEVRAAISVLKREIEIEQGRNIGEDRRSQKYDESKDGHLLVDDLQKAIDAIHDPAIVNRVKNMTFPSNCASSARGSTLCLQAAAKAGDAAYIQYCRAFQNLPGAASSNGWQSQVELTEMLDQARVAYDYELGYINDAIGRLRPLCKIKGWSGNVNVTYTEKVNQTTPMTGTGVQGTITVDYEDSRSATIMMNDGKAVAILHLRG